MTDHDNPRLPPAEVLHRAAVQGEAEQQRRYLDAADADRRAAEAMIAGHPGEWQFEPTRMVVVCREASCRTPARVVTCRRATYTEAVEAVLDAMGQVDQ